MVFGPPLWLVLLIVGGIAWVLFMAVLGVALMVRGWSRRKARYPHGPACRRCGYAVRGLKSLTCPECGADLRGDGVLATGASRPMPMWMWASLFTPALAYPAVLVSVLAVVAGIVPQHIVTTTRSAWIMPRSQGYAWISAWFEIAGRRGAGPIERITLRVSHRAPPPMLSRDSPVILVWSAPELSFSIQDDSGAIREQGQAVDLEVMLRWLTASGVDISKPSVREEAQFILDQVPALQGEGAPALEPHSANGGPFSSTASSVIHVAGATPTWYPPAAGIFWLAVWVAQAHRQRRRIRHTVGGKAADSDLGSPSIA